MYISLNKLSEFRAENSYINNNINNFRYVKSQVMDLKTNILLKLEFF